MRLAGVWRTQRHICADGALITNLKRFKLSLKRYKYPGYSLFPVNIQNVIKDKKALRARILYMDLVSSILAAVNYGLLLLLELCDAT